MQGEQQILEDHKQALIDELFPEPFEWSMIGDNWLASWNWAIQVERETGIDHQVALRFVKENVIPV